MGMTVRSISQLDTTWTIDVRLSLMVQHSSIFYNF
jgi:hypothetical protein